MTDESATVHCPVRDRAMDLEECLACPERIGFKIDPSTGEAWVACRCEPRKPCARDDS